MTEGADQNQDTVERLQNELDELLRQHEQYTLALDAAMDPRTSLRLQRTLERLDEEIEGLQEALKGSKAAAEASAATPEPADNESSSGQAVLPEWDDDDEPATSIYDAIGDLHGAGPGGPGLQPPAPAASQEDPPTVTLSVQPPAGAQPAAAQPGPVAASPTTAVTPPVQGAQAEDPPTVSMAARPAVQPVQPEPSPMMERPAAPPGGASFSSLPPPAAGWGHTEIVPPSYETQPAAQALSPQTQQVPSSPFGGPPAGTPAPPSAGASHPGSPSPFGGPAGNAPFSNTGGYESISDSDGEWSMGSRVLLALLVILFLGGVAYILAQGP